MTVDAGIELNLLYTFQWKHIPKIWNFLHWNLGRPWNQRKLNPQHLPCCFLLFTNLFPLRFGGVFRLLQAAVSSSCLSFPKRVSFWIVKNQGKSSTVSRPFFWMHQRTVWKCDFSQEVSLLPCHGSWYRKWFHAQNLFSACTCLHFFRFVEHWNFQCSWGLTASIPNPWVLSSSCEYCNMHCHIAHTTWRRSVSHVVSFLRRRDLLV